MLVGIVWEKAAPSSCILGVTHWMYNGDDALARGSTTWHTDVCMYMYYIEVVRFAVQG